MTEKEVKIDDEDMVSMSFFSQISGKMVNFGGFFETFSLLLHPSKSS